MNLIGKKFSVQVADSYAEYEVIDQNRFRSTERDGDEVEMVQVGWIRNDYDYMGIFGEEAWVEAAIIAPKVDWYERNHR